MRKLTLLILLLGAYPRENFPKEIVHHIIFLIKLFYEKDSYDKKNYVEISTSETKLLKKVFESAREICDFVKIGFYRDRIQIIDKNRNIKFTLRKEFFDSVRCYYYGIVIKVDTKVVCDILQCVDDSSLLIFKMYAPFPLPEIFPTYAHFEICSQSYYGNNTKNKIALGANCKNYLF